jgi:peptide/nickel transport system permease protein
LLSFALRRVALAVPSLLGLLVITFLMIRMVPADPAAALAGDNATVAQIAQIRQQYGLDQPVWVQFGAYLNGVAHLDFGTSVYSNRAVATDIAQRLPATLELTMVSLVIGIVLGVPLGVVAAVQHNRWPDFAIRVLSVAGLAVAAFWFAIMLQLLFAMQLDWLPLRGRLSDAVRHLVLPAVTLAFGSVATITRFTRAGVLETLQKDFVLYERAVGYPRRRLIWLYVLRNSVVATVTQIGLIFGGLIAGAVVVESIFDWPGIGNYTVQAILTADSKVMLAVTLLVGVVYAVVNILADLVHGWIDPRLMDDL